MKNTFAKMFTVCALAGVLGFALTACDDSSSAVGDDNNVILSSDSREESSDSRSNDKDEAISSDSKSTDSAEVTDKSSDSKDSPSLAGTSTKSSNSNTSGNDAKSSNSSAGKVESSSSKGEVPQSYAEAKVMPLGTYDCTKYKCVTTEYLNQEFLEAGKYGEILDERDGQVYKTISIGVPAKDYSEVWMAQNLNYAPDENHVHSLGDYAWSGCYGGKADSCAKYGRLYTWEVAMDKAGCGYGESCNNSYEGSQGICPAGWHLPSYNEWETLFRNVGGENVAGRKLKSEEGWNYYSESTKGIDYYGFSALPAGRRDDNGDFNSAGDRARFWSSSEHNILYTYGMVLYHKYLGAYLYDESKYDAFSVRCVKDSD